MIKWIMKNSGSACDSSGRRHYFNDGKIIELDKDVFFDKAYASKYVEPKAKKQPEKAQQKPKETASK